METAPDLTYSAVGAPTSGHLGADRDPDEPIIIAKHLLACANSSSPPATASGDGRYFVSWVDTVSQKVKWASADSSSNWFDLRWVDRGVALDNPVAAGVSPSMTFFKGSLWFAVNEESGDNAKPEDCELVNFPTDLAPALAATDTELFCVFKAARSKEILWTRSTDGSNWDGHRPIQLAKSNLAPAIAATKDAVYVAFVDHADDRIYWTSYTGDAGWDDVRPLTPEGFAHFETNTPPALSIADDGEVLLIWSRSDDNAVFASKLTPGDQKWQKAGKILEVGSISQPALLPCVEEGVGAVLAFKGPATGDIWLAAVRDGRSDLRAAHGAAKEGQLSNPSAIADLASLTFDIPITNFGTGRLGFDPHFANVTSTLVLREDGRVLYCGTYTDMEYIPFSGRPPRDYTAVFVLVTSDGLGMVFSRSRSNMPPGKATDSWSITADDEVLSRHWDGVHAHKFMSFTCENATDWNSCVDAAIAEAEAEVGRVRKWIYVLEDRDNSNSRYLSRQIPEEEFAMAGRPTDRPRQWPANPAAVSPWHPSFGDRPTGARQSSGPLPTFLRAVTENI